MSTFTPILHLPEVAPGQDQKETTINTSLAILEAAMNDFMEIDVSAGGDYTFNVEDFTRSFLFKFGGQPATFNINVPNTPRWFALENGGNFNATLQINGTRGQDLIVPSGKIVLVVSDGVNVRMVVPQLGAGLLQDLTDFQGVPSDGKFLAYSSGKWRPTDIPAESFLGLNDTPDTYSNMGTKLVAVKADGSGLEFVEGAAGGLLTFTSLTDVPGSYANAGGYSVRVNAAGTALEFKPIRFTDNGDAPSGYAASDARKFVRVNAGHTGVEFSTAAVADLSDGPGAPAAGQSLRYVRVNSAGTALEYATGTGGPDHFNQLLDVPTSYTGATGKVVRVKSTEDGLTFGRLSYTDLADGPQTYTSNGRKFLQIKPDGTGVQAGLPAVGDISDGPGAFQGNAKKVVRVKTTEDGLEYVKLAITDLDKFPSTLGGAGGKFLMVKADETGLQFVSSSNNTTFLALGDTPDSFTGQANKVVAVSSDATGLVFIDKSTLGATTLAALTDVDETTTAPTDKQVLRYDGTAKKWKPASISLATLTDVDESTGPTNGQALVYDATAQKWKPGTVAATGGGASSLDQLSDVDVSTGPVAGQVLTFKEGVWQAEALPPAGAAALSGLTDVDITTTPQGGQSLVYDSAEHKWKAATVSGGASAPSYGSHAYWRIHITDNVSGGNVNEVNVAELQFHGVVGGPSLCSGGTPIDSKGGGGTPGFAYDGDPASVWYVFPFAGDQWLGYQFASPVSVAEISLTATTQSPNSYIPGHPKTFSIDYSDDGTTWTTAWAVANQINWSAGETRAYAPTLSIGRFLDLTDVPHGYAQAGGQSLRVRSDASGIEFFAPSLTGLSDVDVSTGPVSGQVLTFKDGIWQAESLPAGSGGGGASSLDQLSDVDVSTGPVTGQVLTFKDGVWQAENLPAGSGSSGSGSGGLPQALATCVAHFDSNGAITSQVGINGTLTRRAEGQYTFTFATPMSDTNYGLAFAGRYGDYTTNDAPIINVDRASGLGQTTTHVDILSLNATGGIYDVTYLSVFVFDPLASSGGGASSLDQLSDVDVSTGPVAGQVLTFKDGVWQAETPATVAAGGGGASTPEALLAHSYWRVLNLGFVGASNAALCIAEAQFRTTVGGAQAAVGGTPLASGQVGSPASAAYDGDLSTFWDTGAIGSPTGAWLGYHFTAPVAVREFTLTSRNDSTYGDLAPRTFAIQYSDDGATWATAWITSTPQWGASQQRSFAFPTDEATGGSGGGVSRLDALTDVDVSTGPVDGQVLTFKDGVWQAETPTATESGGGSGLPTLVCHRPTAAEFSVDVLGRGASATLTTIDDPVAGIIIEDNGTEGTALKARVRPIPSANSAAFSFAAQMDIVIGGNANADAGLALYDGTSFTLFGILFTQNTYRYYVGYWDGSNYHDVSYQTITDIVEARWLKVAYSTITGDLGFYSSANGSVWKRIPWNGTETLGAVGIGTPTHAGFTLGRSGSGPPLVSVSAIISDEFPATTGTTGAGGGGGGGGSSTLAGLTDVDETASPTAGQALVYDATAHKWKPGTAAVPPLSGLSDVSPVTPTAGQLLAWDATAGLWRPTTIAGATVPWDFSPPLAASLPTLIGTVPPTVADDTDVGLLITSGSLVSGDVQRAAARAIPSPTAPWTVVSKLMMSTSSGSYTCTGLTLIEQTTGRLIIFGVESTDASFNVRISHLTIPSGYNGNPYDTSGTASLPSLTWFKVVFDGSTYTYYISGDGKLWSRVYSESATNYFSSGADHIGIGFSLNRNDSTNQIGVSCPYWKFTQ